MVSDVSVHVMDCHSMFKWSITANTITSPAPTVVQVQRRGADHKSLIRDWSEVMSITTNVLSR